MPKFANEIIALWQQNCSFYCELKSKNEKKWSEYWINLKKCLYMVV